MITWPYTSPILSKNGGIIRTLGCAFPNKEDLMITTRGKVKL